MIKIKYNNQSNFEEVTFSKIGNLVSLKGATENNSGFKTYRLSGEQLGDFSDYTTIYDKDEDFIVFSKDGSVKPDPQPYESTVEDKIRELKSELAATDYQIIKCSECQLLGQPMPYDVAELHAQRQAIRDAINKLEE